MMENGLSAADVLALTRGGDNDDGMNGMWNNPFVYLVWIWAFNAFGGGGFGGANAQAALTRSDLHDGFTMNNIERQIQGVQQGLCDGFYANNTSILQGFAGVDRSLCAGFNSLGNQIAESRFAAQNCCCETNRNIDAVRYENAKNTCDIITAGNLNTRDIIEAQNRGVQRIVDTLTQDKIESLRTELQAAQLQLGNLAQTQTIINAVRPFPQPSYITCSPYQTSTNCGCGCV